MIGGYGTVDCWIAAAIQVLARLTPFIAAARRERLALTLAIVAAGNDYSRQRSRNSA